MESSTTFQVDTTLIWLIVLGLFSENKATCDLKVDSPHSSGVHVPGPRTHPSVVPPRHPRYSCTPCEDTTPYEVHILDIYQPTGAQGGDWQRPHNVKTVKVNILANSTVRLELLLVSYEAANWLIDKPEAVNISRVILMSAYNEYSSVKLAGEGHVNVEKRTRPLSYKDNTDIIDYARTNLGAVTSYSVVWETLQWWLTVGDCPTSTVDVNTSVSTVSPLNQTTPDLNDCVNRGRKPCWVEYNFVYESEVYECKGKQYVTEYRLDRMYYIGAILCTTRRYSLFMTTSLQEPFLGIIDINGSGEDHCEVLGVYGSSRYKTKSVRVRRFRFGFYRSYWGDPFRKGIIKSGWAPEWYECGITIPWSGVVHPTTTTTTETPSSPLRKQGFNTVAFVSIIGTLLVVLVITAALLRYNARKEMPQSEHVFRLPQRSAPPSPSRPAHLAPSAPPPAAPPTQDTSLLPPPPTQDTSLLPPPPPHDGGTVQDVAPPAYDDIMNYPPAKTTVAPPPYRHI